MFISAFCSSSKSCLPFFLCSGDRVRPSDHFPRGCVRYSLKSESAEAGEGRSNDDDDFDLEGKKMTPNNANATGPVTTTTAEKVRVASCRIESVRHSLQPIQHKITPVIQLAKFA